MPTKKQRRRQQKSRRHEWEYVYVDEEGQEVEVDPTELKRPKEQKNGARASTSATPRTNARGRAGREIQPPSWRRVARRALFIGPAFILVMLLLDRNQPVATRVAPAVFLLLFFIPFSYFTDSLAYRMYKKRLERAGGSAPTKAKPKPKTR